MRLLMMRLCSRVLSKLGLSHWISFPQGGYRLRLCPETESRWLQPIDAPRPVEEFFRRYLKQGDVVIDAGANVGIFTMVAAMKTGPTGRVHSIEPHPNTFKLLLQHIADNQATNVKAYQLVLGLDKGTTEFSDNLDSSDLNHVVPKGTDGITVPVERLDDLMIDGPVDLLKVDVEGYELFVFKGAQKLLSRVRCILFEVENEKCAQFGYGAVDLLNIVRSHGFRILRIVYNNAAEVPLDFTPCQPEDLVAVRDLNEFFERTGYRNELADPGVPSLRMHRSR